MFTMIFCASGSLPFMKCFTNDSLTMNRSGAAQLDARLTAGFLRGQTGLNELFALLVEMEAQLVIHFLIAAAVHLSASFGARKRAMICEVASHCLVSRSRRFLPIGVSR